MQLQSFQHKGFEFSLVFINGESILVNLKPLIGKYISEKDLNSAHIDSEWGCLEFKGGTVDIDPITLYHYAVTNCAGGGAGSRLMKNRLEVALANFVLPV